MSLRSLVLGIAIVCFAVSAGYAQETDVKKTREYSAMTGIPIFAIVGSET